MTEHLDAGGHLVLDSEHIRRIIREENQPIIDKVDALDRAIRGANGHTGLVAKAEDNAKEIHRIRGEMANRTNHIRGLWIGLGGAVVGGLIKWWAGQH